MTRRAIVPVLLALCCGLRGLFAATDQQVNNRIAVLQQEIVRQQQADGSWAYRGGYTVGSTALCLLALKHSGLANNHPSVLRATNFVVQHTDEKVYSEALVATALELVDPKTHRARIARSVDYLVRAQCRNGQWSYDDSNRPSGDNSNTQFAILGLAAGERAGIRIPEDTRRRARAYWNENMTNGGWAYAGAGQPTFSMTCAGVASLHLLGVKWARRNNCCEDYRYDQECSAGLRWIAAVLKNNGLARQNHYGLYALERVAIFYGFKEIDGVDWYREGADRLLRDNPRGVDLANTAFSLLFLARGSPPIAIAKWQWDGDWNRQLYDAENWVRHSGAILDRKLDWVAAKLGPLDSPAAKASIIFVTGSQAFRATDREIDFLRSFLEAGGTVIAEGTCDGEAFGKAFTRRLEDGLYPEFRPEWKRVDANHEVCRSHYSLTAGEVSAWQLECGCRNVRLLYLSRPISCALNGDRDSLQDQERAFKVATNIMAWALGSKAADKKLDRQELELVKQREAITVDQLQRVRAQRGRQFAQPMGRLRHEGDWNYGPLFFNNLQGGLADNQALPQFDGEVYVRPESEDLNHCAVTFLTGHRRPELDERQWIALRAYLQHGGFLFATAACSTEEFDAGFRQLMTDTLPNDRLEAIPPDDPIWQQPYRLRDAKPQVTPAFARKFGDDWGPLLGIRREGRWIVVYSPVDAVSALSEGIHRDIPGYERQSAFKLIANLCTYAFTP